MAKHVVLWILQFCYGFQVKGPEGDFKGLEQRDFW